MWGPPGTFSPDCLESPTPETYASGGSLSPRRPTPLGAVSLPVWSFAADQTWSQGRLRCLRAIPLEVPLLSTVIANPSLFTWAPLGVFLGCLRTFFIAIAKASTFSFVFFLPFFPYHNRLSEPVVTEYLKTDLVHTPVLIAYGGYLEPTE